MILDINRFAVRLKVRYRSSLGNASERPFDPATAITFAVPTREKEGRKMRDDESMADQIINGDFCEGCGEYLDEGDEYPRKGKCCGGK